MCGEKNIWVADVTTSIGSPPHVRGKALENGGGSLDVRITPACAGKRLIQARHAVKRQDHPRVCGEKGDPSCR